MNVNFGTINLKVITGAQHTEICGFMDDGSLKIKLHAKPIEGKANLELIKFLAEVGISRQEVKLLRISVATQSGQGYWTNSRPTRYKIARIIEDQGHK